MTTYHVQLLLPDGVTYWTVCECLTAEALAEVIRIFFNIGVNPPGQLLIRRVD